MDAAAAGLFRRLGWNVQLPDTGFRNDIFLSFERIGISQRGLRLYGVYDFSRYLCRRRNFIILLKNEKGRGVTSRRKARFLATKKYPKSRDLGYFLSIILLKSKKRKAKPCGILLHDSRFLITSKNFLGRIS